MQYICKCFDVLRRSWKGNISVHPIYADSVFLSGIAYLRCQFDSWHKIRPWYTRVNVLFWQYRNHSAFGLLYRRPIRMRDLSPIGLRLLWLGGNAVNNFLIWQTRKFKFRNEYLGNQSQKQNVKGSAAVIECHNSWTKLYLPRWCLIPSTNVVLTVSAGDFSPGNTGAAILCAVTQSPAGHLHIWAEPQM